MSDDLFATRLRWAGARGVAKLHGKQVRLEAAPVIDGLEFEELDYTPEVSVAIVRDIHGKSREMRREEILACDLYLAKVAF